MLILLQRIRLLAVIPLLLSQTQVNVSNVPKTAPVRQEQVFLDKPTVWKTDNTPLKQCEAAGGVFNNETCVIPTPTPSVVPTTSPQAVFKQNLSISEQDAKLFIYNHESGNNPNSINASSGACGLGQALPCSKMPCALGDYDCQDSFFTGYMQSRYGTWQNAYEFWLSHSWW